MTMADQRPAGLPGHAGYGGAMIDAFHTASESLTFEQVHRPSLDLIPATPGRALDVGTGTGRDAAALAARGWSVVAAEPVAAFRDVARSAHPHPAITWLDDALPHLAAVRALGHTYDLVIASACWMHQDAAERAIAMPVIAGLTRPGGVFLVTLRHGPVPPGRWMADVPGDEVVAQATAAGFRPLRRLDDQPSLLPNKLDVTWTHLAFLRG